MVRFMLSDNMLVVSVVKIYDFLTKIWLVEVGLWQGAF